MAKKKTKNKDFQKVKLKVGRKLVRGTNDTKTDFKSKKIIVKELESRAKDPIKTLSNGFSINNQTKIFCLSGVDKWLNSSNINSRGGEVITTVSRYLSDSDHRVRSDCIKCLKHCISLLHSNEEKSCSPLMPVILTYINCGLTHIDDHISSDSLKLLSHFIDFSEKSLFNQLMQTIITTFDRNSSKINPNVFEVCYKLVSVMNRQESNSIPSQKKEPTVLNWSPNDNYCDIWRYEDEDKPRFDVNISFQTTSSVDIKEKFFRQIENIVKTELKLLLPKTTNGLILTVSEARKAVFALKIASIMGLPSDLIQKVPNISINGINNNHKSNRKQTQVINHLSAELNASINKMFNYKKQ